MTPTLVLNVVGLTAELLGEHTPNLSALASGGWQRNIGSLVPAVTCSVQSTYLTGLPVSGHGIVGNGWFHRELNEVLFWRQSNALVKGPKLWELARQRDASFTVAQMFWWYNMYSSADYSVTPRPMYLADGRKLPDVYSEPPELRAELQEELGQFPLFKFWGPAASMESSQWIADASRSVLAAKDPTLMLVYLPHLDYCLQQYGPQDPRVVPELRAVDAACGELIEAASQQGRRVVALSEYGIGEVSAPVHINRHLREAGLLRVRVERERELLDAGASQAFAVADHQIAHIYVRDPQQVAVVAELLRSVEGVESVWGAEQQAERGLAHPRGGELVVVSRADRWFSYYYWLEDERAPDFARTVEIHRKPGYDPVELFLDPQIQFPRLKLGLKLLGKELGLRTLMDVIPLDASLVRGSHGRPPDRPERGPLLLSSEAQLAPEDEGSVVPTDVQSLLLRHLFD